MDTASKVWSAYNRTNCYQRYGLAHDTFHNESQATHVTPIVSRSALRAVSAAHR